MPQEYLSYKEPVSRRALREGMAMMGWGVAETVRSEIRSAAFMGLIGAMWGIGVGVLKNDSLPENAVKYAKKGARWGAIWGWMGAASEYNAYAEKMNLPKVRWFDAITANILALRAYNHDKPFLTWDRPAALAMTQVLNPVTVRGVRRVAESAVMALGE